MLPPISLPYRLASVWLVVATLLAAPASATLLAAPASAALIDMATPVTAPPLVSVPAAAAVPALGSDLIDVARHGRATLAINLAILALGSLWLALAARRFGASSAARRPAAAGR